MIKPVKAGTAWPQDPAQGRTLKLLRPGWLPGLVLTVGLLTTAVFCNSERHYRQLEHERIERTLAADITELINARINTTVAILDAVAGLFNTTKTVRLSTYSTFFESLHINPDNLRGIQGIGFIQVFPPNQRDAIEQSVRNDRQPDFTIHPRRDANQLSAITYLQPSDWRNQRALGYDLLSEPVRREAMRLAASTGEISLSHPVRLLQETNIRTQAGTLLFRPIYTNPSEPFSSAVDRLRRLRGWSYAPMRMGDLFNSVMASLNNPDKTGTAVLVYDGTKPLRQNLLYDNLNMAEGTSLTHPTWVPMAIANRTWLVGIQLDHRHISPTGLSTDVLRTALLGISLSLLAAAVTNKLVKGHLALRDALRLEQNAASERALASTVFDASPLGILVTDPDGVILRVNIAFTQISGYSLIEARGRKANLLKSGRHDQGFYHQFWQALKQHGHWSGEIWNRHQTGQIRRHDLNVTAVYDARDQIVNYVGLLRDVTERYSQEEQMRHLATHDPLTGLANRALLREHLARSLALAKRQHSQVGLLFLDLDGFKPVNDRFGHSTGDALLQAVAARLLASVRASDTLCRQGGDEFVLLIPEGPDLDQLTALAGKLQARIRESYPQLPEGVHISASIGIARWPDHAEDADSLLDAADNAMYLAKGSGGQSIAIAPKRAPTVTAEGPLDAATGTALSGGEGR